MDIHAYGSRTSAHKALFSCAPNDGVKVFGSGRPPGYPPGRPHDIPPNNFLFRLLSYSWHVEEKLSVSPSVWESGLPSFSGFGAPEGPQETTRGSAYLPAVCSWPYDIMFFMALGSNGLKGCASSWLVCSFSLCLCNCVHKKLSLSIYIYMLWSYYLVQVWGF